MTNNNQVAIIQKDITDDVNKSIERLQDDGLTLPANYNYSNALKSAFFKLQETKDRNNKPALEVCSRGSIANALLDMVTQGLSPAKTQCYFIVYGTQLQLNRSYFGTQAVLKRLTNVKDIWANVIFEGDEFDYEIDGGREKLVKHTTNFLNRDNKILGDYAVVKTSEDEEILTVMTKKEIDASWGQAKTKNVQNKFPQEMAKRTVINRAAKAFINTSDDSDLLVDAINRSTENEYDNERKDITPEEDTLKQIEQNANTIDFDEAVEQQNDSRQVEKQETDNQLKQEAQRNEDDPNGVQQTILDMQVQENTGNDEVPF